MSMQLWSLPDILTIHLKRFSFNSQLQAVFNSGEKINTEVQFPLSGLDLAPYLVVSQQEALAAGNAIYDLYAVSNHYGSMGFGHYTAFVKKESGQWVLCDDSKCSPVEPDEVVTPGAYVLFYQQRRTHQDDLSAASKLDDSLGTTTTVDCEESQDAESADMGQAAPQAAPTVGSEEAAGSVEAAHHGESDRLRGLLEVD